MTEENFFTKLPYLIFISLITLAIWFFGQEELGGFLIQDLGLYLFSTIVFILLLSIKNTIHIVPFLLNMLFMISQTNWDIDLIPNSMYYVIALLILGIILHIVIYKTKFLRGKFFLGISFLGVAVIISMIVNNQAFSMLSLLLFLYIIFLILLYGFFANTVEGEFLVYLIRIFVVLGILISLEVAIFYMREDDVIHALEAKTLNLGWGISNFIATYLIMFISSTVYFIKKYKLHIFWIVLALFEFVMLLFTLSRAGIIAFLITSLFLLLFMFIKYEHKWNLLLNIVIGVLIVGIMAYFTKVYFYAIWERLELYRLEDNGRIEIWKEAIATFRTHLVFGGGVLARQADGLRMFHNTILHILACFGILGGIALVIQFISLLRIFFVGFTQEKAILLIALIGANIHGMVDNIYLMPQYMTIMFIIIAFVESANKIDILRKELRIS